jgi:cysteine synthase A
MDRLEMAFPLDPASSPTMATCGKVVGPHRIFGIGDEFVPAIVKLDQLDNILLIDDCDAINMARNTLRLKN